MSLLIRALTALVVLIAVINAVAVAVPLVILAGLIFRTKQTLAFLGFCAVLAAFAAHPVIGLAVIGVSSVIAWLKKGEQPDEKVKELPPYGD